MDLVVEQIHLWYIPLGNQISASELYILSSAELKQANGFHFNKDRNNYILRHLALRKILSKYCLLNCSDIDFKTTNYQKPYLDNNIHDLQFNMSSSGNIAILAITKNHSIGVDVEYVNPINDMDDLVKRFFSKEEQTKFLALPEMHKLKAFYTIWTRKEAFVKATGHGLNYPLDQFDVSFSRSEPTRIIQINNSVIEANKWALNEIAFTHANNNYIAAIITKSSPKNIICFHYQ